MTQRAERRSKQQWQDIFVQQAQSGLTALQFCQQHDIKYATFSARLSDYRHHWRSHNKRAKQKVSDHVSVQMEKMHRFVKVKQVTTEKTERVEAYEPSKIELTTGAVTLSLPVNCDTDWLVRIVRGLNT